MRRMRSSTVALVLAFELAAGPVRAQDEVDPSAEPGGAAAEAPEAAERSDEAVADAETETGDAGPPTSGAPTELEPEGGAGDEASMRDIEALLGESVVTTASRSAERAITAPASVFTITAREIWTYGMRSIDEVLNFLGVGTYITRPRDFVSGQDIGIQGVMLRDAGRHVLLLLDGHIINSQTRGDTVLHEGIGVPLEAIDHLEVMLGPGSVIYGSNAMFAVINVVTRTPDVIRGVGAYAELGVSAPQDEDGFATVPGAGERAGLRYRFGVYGAAQLDISDVPADFTIHAEWLEDINNSYRIAPTPGGFNVELRPGDTTWGGIAQHTVQAPSVVASLHLGDFRLRFNANHYERGMPLVASFDDPDARERRRAIRLDLRHSVALDEEATLTSRLYADYMDWNESSVWTAPYWCPPGHPDGCNFEQRAVSRWVGFEQQLVVDWDLDGRVTTTAGYDLRVRDGTGRSADYTDIATGIPSYTTPAPYFDSVTFLGAIFAEQVWQPFDSLGFDVGARLDLDSIFGAWLSPRAAILVMPNDDTTVRATYNEAFRGPTVWELNENDPTYRIPAPQLRPEVMRAVELEWQQRISFFKFTLRGYASFYEDFVNTRLATEQEYDAANGRGELASTAEFGNVVLYDNLRSLRALGATLGFQLRPVDGLVIAGSISLADSRIDETVAPILPVWMGNARVGYEFEPEGASINVTAALTGDRAATLEPIWSVETPVYTGESLDLRASFSAPISFLPGLQLRTSIGYAVNPSLPYLLSAPTTDNPEWPVRLIPATSQINGFIGLRYELDPAEPTESQ
jgi:outer membrane receptor for ferrienterochelin and colicins